MYRDDVAALARGLVDGAYIDQGTTELRRREACVRSLLAQRSIPEAPWPEDTISFFLAQLALMDSNNFSGAVGAGEREGRIFSDLVRRRHFGLGHGIGRSGDVAAVQPKAAGSSLIYKLTNKLAAHAVRLCGITRTEAALVLPTATGLTLSLVFLTLMGLRRKQFESAVAAKSRCGSRPGVADRHIEHGAASEPTRVVAEPRIATEERVLPSTEPRACPDADRRAASPTRPVPAAVFPQYLIWSRIDQKSCYKSLLTAGCVPIVVEPLRRGDELVTDVEGIQGAIAALPTHAIVAVVSTTSCFAPRAPDDVVEVAKLCKAAGVPHVINNAYGLQVGSICHAVNEACRVGRVDAFVSSADKNFMVRAQRAQL
jgi:O-phospho-L-seryl-tRNASec:L-selenocysteinyl-tRNA synthase